MKKSKYTTELNKKIVDTFLEQLKSKRKYKWVDNRKKLFYCYNVRNDAEFVNKCSINNKLTVNDLATGNFDIDS